MTFDCWGTLLAEPGWGEAHGRRVEALQRVALGTGRRIGTEEARAAFDTGWRRHMELWKAGVASGAPEVVRCALEVLALPVAPEAELRLVRQVEEASLSGEVCAIDGSRRTLGRLAAEGVRMALICDTGLSPGRVVRTLLDRAGLLGLLEIQVFSDEVGAPKPDPRPFRAALAPLGTSPGEAVHVGDLRRTDVAGARAFGMRTVRIRGHYDDRSELPEADAVADSHAHLLGLLGFSA